jgi:hypothetical protein
VIPLMCLSSVLGYLKVIAWIYLSVFTYENLRRLCIIYRILEEFL